MQSSQGSRKGQWLMWLWLSGVTLAACIPIMPLVTIREFGHTVPGLLIWWIFLVAFLVRPISDSKVLLRGGLTWVMILISIVFGIHALFGSIRGVTFPHRLHHAFFAATLFAWASCSLAELRCILLPGSSSLMLACTLACSAFVLAGHQVPHAVEDHGHRLVAMSLMAAGLSSAGMAKDAWVQPSRVMLLYFLSLTGVCLTSIGRWRVSTRISDHADVMTMHLFIGIEALTIASMCILRVSLHGSSAYVTASPQEAGADVPEDA